MSKMLSWKAEIDQMVPADFYWLVPYLYYLCFHQTGLDSFLHSWCAPLFCVLSLFVLCVPGLSLMAVVVALSRVSQTLHSRSRMRRSWALMMTSRRTPMTTAGVGRLSVPLLIALQMRSVLRVYETNCNSFLYPILIMRIFPQKKTQVHDLLHIIITQ